MPHQLAAAGLHQPVCSNVRKMGREINHQEKFGHLWLAEAERFEHFDSDWDAMVAADLADEVVDDVYAAMASDPEFDDLSSYWDIFLFQHDLRLAVEQSCHRGILLPMEQRIMRLRSCPEVMLKPLRRFFEDCPRDVRSWLAHVNYWVARIERARRTGSPTWRPQTALPAPEKSAFFRPQIWQGRNYSR